jgi:hypothetical protein
LFFLAGIGSTLYDKRFSTVKTGDVKYEKKTTEESRWEWDTYRIEYSLYVDRGYNLRWLESKPIQKMREYLGDLFLFVEIIMMRLFGALSYFIPVFIIFVLMVSKGSVHYYNKRFLFKHISSTFNNASIKILFWVIPLTLLWAMLPLGINVPLFGEIPNLISIPGVGIVWIASPAVGAVFFGSLFGLVGAFLGANFSREI